MSLVKFAIPVFLAVSARAQTQPFQIRVDATAATRRLIKAEMHFPVKTGPLSLMYPKWIPGEHGPTGPIVDLAGLKISGNGKPISWRRDDVEMYEFHVDVPAGVSTLDVQVEYILPPESGGFSSGSSTSSQLAVLSWNQFLLYPKGAPSDQLRFQANMTVPAGWRYALLWLEADVMIRTLSMGTKSIDDFCKAWAGGPSNGAEVKPYGFDDVMRTLNSVQPYDWTKFWRDRLTSTAPHAPLGGIENGGYKLVYTSERPGLAQAAETARKFTSLAYSLGLSFKDTGEIVDVKLGMPAEKAGIAPATKIIAVNGREFSPKLLRNVVEDAVKTSAAIVLLIKDGDYYKSFSIEYHGGEKYPHLVRDESKPDLISDIIRPRAGK